MTQTLTHIDADRQLLAAVHRWARTNGWCQTGSGWTNAPTARTATVRVDWVLDDPAIRVWRKSADGQSWSWGRAREYEAETVRQAVDILVDLGILPDTLHRLYPQVATVNELTDELRRVRERLADERAAHARGSKNFDAMERLNSELHMQAQVQRQRADRYRDRHDEAAKELSNERVKVMRLAEVRVWRNEDGKEFMFADDVRAALDAPQDNPYRRCRHCGSTTGLRMLAGSPLVITREWECRNGCKGGERP